MKLFYNYKEKIYILSRIIKAFSNSVFFYICRIFPIKKNRVAICCFEGKGGFGCNPKYIVLELHKLMPDIEFVWLVDDVSKVFPNYIKKVVNTSINRAYWMSTSQVWIDNYRTRYGTKKRKGQYYLNTNHYTVGIKSVGLWRGDRFSKLAYLISKADSDMIDDLIIDSDFCIEMCPKGLIYNGKFLKIGAPRCDILYGDRIDQRIKFRKKHLISLDAKVVMFAPTFREGKKNGKRYVFSENWSIDFIELVKIFEKKFGGKWYICLRVHPQLADSFCEFKNNDINEVLINESRTDDMYELLAGMDAYITDYSSACFEAAYARIPVFLYADDIDDYSRDRGALFWNLRNDNLRDVRLNPLIFKKTRTRLPFSVATNNEELKNNILEFERNKYEADVEQFCKDIKLVFNGNASKVVASKILKMMEINPY